MLAQILDNQRIKPLSQAEHGVMEWPITGLRTLELRYNECIRGKSYYCPLSRVLSCPSFHQQIGAIDRVRPSISLSVRQRGMIGPDKLTVNLFLFLGFSWGFSGNEMV